jgi:hypothetical protein
MLMEEEQQNGGQAHDAPGREDGVDPADIVAGRRVERNKPVSRSLLRLIRLSAGSWERCRPLRDALRAAAIAEIIRPLCDEERYKPVAFHGAV